VAAGLSPGLKSNDRTISFGQTVSTTRNQTSGEGDGGWPLNLVAGKRLLKSTKWILSNRQAVEVLPRYYELIRAFVWVLPGSILSAVAAIAAIPRSRAG
jgi:hypothetical protein